MHCVALSTSEPIPSFLFIMLAFLTLSTLLVSLFLTLFPRQTSSQCISFNPIDRNKVIKLIPCPLTKEKLNKQKLDEQQTSPEQKFSVSLNCTASQQICQQV